MVEVKVVNIIASIRLDPPLPFEEVVARLSSDLRFTVKGFEKGVRASLGSVRASFFRTGQVTVMKCPNMEALMRLGRALEEALGVSVSIMIQNIVAVVKLGRVDISKLGEQAPGGRLPGVFVKLSNGLTATVYRTGTAILPGTRRLEELEQAVRELVEILRARGALVEEGSG